MVLCDEGPRRIKLNQHYLAIPTAGVIFLRFIINID